MKISPWFLSLVLCSACYAQEAVPVVQTPAQAVTAPPSGVDASAPLVVTPAPAPFVPAVAAVPYVQAAPHVVAVSHDAAADPGPDPAPPPATSAQMDTLIALQTAAMQYDENIQMDARTTRVEVAALCAVGVFIGLPAIYILRSKGQG